LQEPGSLSTKLVSIPLLISRVVWHMLKKNSYAAFSLPYGIMIPKSKQTNLLKRFAGSAGVIARSAHKLICSGLVPGFLSNFCLIVGWLLLLNLFTAQALMLPRGL
jgi:hypothetical protein